MNKKEKTTYRPFYDGWFNYFFCERCGNKAFKKPDTCPNCGCVVEEEVTDDEISGAKS